jgi:CheY-like chemotaxis protein
VLVAYFMRGLGFDVFEASSREDAVRGMEAGFPADLILSDMPQAKMDGIALARWVRVNRPEGKVLLASGVVSRPEPSDASLCKGPILFKPYKFDQLEGTPSRLSWSRLDPARTPASHFLDLGEARG